MITKTAWLPGLLLLMLCGCVVLPRAPSAARPYRIITNGSFRLTSGVRLPYRDWLPKTPPRRVVLALHGFNDSRNAWATAGPRLARAGIAVFAPDQAGFGATRTRGIWPGTARLLRDAREMVNSLHARYPGVPLTLMGESMGGAETLLLGASHDPAISAYVVISPAVWGGRAMTWQLHATIDVADTFAPWLSLTGQQAHISASDNRAALIALSNDPLTIHATRIAAVAGLVRLMGRAQAACAHFAPKHALIMYGGHDQLIPKSAMAACWRALPRVPGVRLADYPPDYHLMLLDHQRAIPRNDIISFILHPDRPLPSDAATAALIFLAER